MVVRTSDGRLKVTLVEAAAHFEVTTRTIQNWIRADDLVTFSDNSRRDRTLVYLDELDVVANRMAATRRTQRIANLSRVSRISG